jgi:hypothetical protein
MGFESAYSINTEVGLLLASGRVNGSANWRLGA